MRDPAAWRRGVAIALAALVTAACGGGGSGTAASRPGATSPAGEPAARPTATLPASTGSPVR